ncbi:MAG TPA: arsinothricin resistance N-acetyltransferase ArsN1 family B [Aggregatilineaceae bacterium]|nr:arsinothricin resistance N-acetyltransferase ArsN1 family B [Aggregatilineaceae bacterium]
MKPIIRPAAEGDAEPIQVIYAPVVRDTATSFELEVPGVEAIRERILDKLVHFPWLVCEYQNEVLGYVYAGKHRERAAYQWAVDVSVYVSADYRRAGIGRALYTSLFAVLKLQGFYNAFAGIALPNPASVGLHTALGFQPIGVYRHVGYKLGAWHDVGWWHLTLQPLTDHPTSPGDFSQLRTSEECQQALAAGLPLLRL